MKKNLTAIILAAGRSIRMKSDTPKVLHKICGRAMLSYPIDLCLRLKVKQIIIVLGCGKDRILNYLSQNYKHRNIEVVLQRKPKGTADAVLSAKSKIARGASDLLIIYADQTLLSLNTARKLLNRYYDSDADAALFTARLDEPFGYGRIIRNQQGQIVSIREDKDLKKDEINLREVNAGSCVFKKEELFRIIKNIKPDNKKREYYLTEAIKLFSYAGLKISSVTASDTSEVLGGNSRSDLVRLEEILRKRSIDRFLMQGVTIVSPNTTFINSGVKIGRDTVLNPFVYIDNDVTIGKNCVIGPFCHIRGGSVIKDNVIVGSFAELNRSYVDRHSKIKHFTYLGDADLGKNVNIGAGVVTANFDGKNKYKTQIKNGAFIGSDTILVAPLKVGRFAITGAGCVIPKHKDVADGTVVWGVPARVQPQRPQKKNRDHRL